MKLTAIRALIADYEHLACPEAEDDEEVRKMRLKLVADARKELARIEKL